MEGLEGKLRDTADVITDRYGYSIKVVCGNTN